MAIASGRAGRVLARPPLCGLNVHVRTLNTREVVRTRTSFHRQRGNVALGFSVISIAIPYSDEPRAAHGRCAQLSSYAESEITSLVPQAPSSFPSFTVRSTMESWAGACEQDYSLGTQCESE